MRTFSYCIGLAALALTAVSCNDRLDMLTVINSDGSCYREISIPADSFLLTASEDNIEEHVKGLMSDASWTKVWRVIGSEENHAYPMTVGRYDSVMASFRVADECITPRDSLVVCASRSFGSVAEMSAELPFTVDGRRISSSASLEKKFRWFRTDYTFNETFSGFGSRFSIPVSGFLEEDEVSFWLTGSPDLIGDFSGLEVKEMLDDIEERFWRWVNANIMSDAIGVIADNYDMVSGAPVDRDGFAAQKDSLLSFLVEYGYEIWPNDPENSLENGLDKFFRTNAFSKALGDYGDDTLSGLVELDLHFYESLNSLQVDYSLLMPGDEEERHFVLSGPRMALNDYSISATSQVTNRWAYVLMLLVAVTAVALTAAIKRR